MSYISGVFTSGIEEVKKSWGWFFVCGVVLLALGAMCIVKDQTATTFSILALGWALLISAVVWFVNSFQAWRWGFKLLLQWHSRPATQAVPAKINLNDNVRKATALKHKRSLRTATSSSA
jgi:Short repeat of unknown function (DUF308)